MNNFISIHINIYRINHLLILMNSPINIDMHIQITIYMNINMIIDMNT